MQQVMYITQIFGQITSAWIDQSDAAAGQKNHEGDDRHQDIEEHTSDRGNPTQNAPKLQSDAGGHVPGEHGHRDHSIANWIVDYINQHT